MRVKSPLRTAVVLVVVVGVFYAVTHLTLPNLDSLKLAPRISSIQVVDESYVSVRWKIRNEGDDPAFFRSCTIDVGGSRGVAGSWSGGNTGVVLLSSQKSYATRVRVTSGSANLVTTRGTKVSCTGLVDAHAGS